MWKGFHNGNSMTYQVSQIGKKIHSVQVNFIPTRVIKEDEQYHK